MVEIQLDVEVPMRDGSMLRADVWRPRAGRPGPALVQRQPYDRANLGNLIETGLDPLAAVRAGYAVVNQDTRGQGGSDGTFAPYRDEALDGFDTIAWIAEQEWSDGRVCGFGGSYLGTTQLLAATERPPALRAIAPYMTGAEHYEGWTYSGGAFQLGFALFYAMLLAQAALGRRLAGAGGAARGALLEHQEALAALLEDPWTAFRRLPLVDQPLMCELLPAYRDWLTHPLRDGYWSATAIADRYGSIDVPALHVGGWSDLFLEGTLRNYAGLRAGAASASAREGQRLIVGPWSHGNQSDCVGELYLGPGASQAAFGAGRVQLAFFDDALGGDLDAIPPVRVFVIGPNRWRDEDEWPPRRARVEELHLRAQGTLDPRPPASDEAPARFRYDPRAPVPTIGGRTFLPGTRTDFQAGFRDRRALAARADVLVYVSPPLLEDVELAGMVVLALHTASDAPDTDWTGALVDVTPEGAALGVVDGVIRARARHGLERADLLTPDAPERYEIELGSICWRLRAGHRIGLHVSSSNFPRFDRNPNHGGDIATAAEADLRVASQRVFHDAARPSTLLLPVLGPLRLATPERTAHAAA